MDKDGYPDENELKKIEEWDYKDLSAMMEYVKERWKYSDWGWSQKGNLYYLSTGGWSGNESLIGAMEKNLMFWSLCWLSSRRGGHYEFEVKGGK